MRNCPEEIANVLLISGSQDKLSWRNFILAKTLSYCFSRSSIKFQVHTGWKIEYLNQILSKINRPVAAIKSLRFAFFHCRYFECTDSLNFTYDFNCIGSIFDFVLILFECFYDILLPLLMLRPDYIWKTRSISWLLMSWLLALPG